MFFFHHMLFFLKAHRSGDKGQGWSGLGVPMRCQQKVSTVQPKNICLFWKDGSDLIT